MVRDMQFVTAVKSKMGPDKTLCVQTQRFVVYSGQRLLFQTSQTMNDIPYSDHFTVRQGEGSGGGCCRGGACPPCRRRCSGM